MLRDCTDEWKAIGVMVDGLNRPNARTYTDEQLGAMFRSYVCESQHGGWDGFNPRDLTGIRRMLFDMTLYARDYES